MVELTFLKHWGGIFHDENETNFRRLPACGDYVWDRYAAGIETLVCLCARKFFFVYQFELTYWPRKCATWCAPRDESFHQVWSSYDHPLPSYSVIAADTLRDLVTLTSDLLTLVSGHTLRVTWSNPTPSLKILRLSVLEIWVVTSPIGYHWQCVCSHCACAVSRDLCVGANFSRIFEIADPDLPIHWATSWLYH